MPSELCETFFITTTLSKSEKFNYPALICQIKDKVLKFVSALNFLVPLKTFPVSIGKQSQRKNIVGIRKALKAL